MHVINTVDIVSHSRNTSVVVLYRGNVMAKLTSVSDPIYLTPQNSYNILVNVPGGVWTGTATVEMAIDASSDSWTEIEGFSGIAENVGDESVNGGKWIRLNPGSAADVILDISQSNQDVS